MTARGGVGGSGGTLGPMLRDTLVFTTDRDGPRNLYTMDTGGSNVASLTTGPTVDGGARVSPDGTKVTFVRGDKGELDIWVIDADGSNPVNLSNYIGFESVPAWSPDGTKIAFRRNLGTNSDSSPRPAGFPQIVGMGFAALGIPRHSGAAIRQSGCPKGACRDRCRRRFWRVLMVVPSNGRS